MYIWRRQLLEPYTHIWVPPEYKPIAEKLNINKTNWIVNEQINILFIIWKICVYKYKIYARNLKWSAKIWDRVPQICFVAYVLFTSNRPVLKGLIWSTLKHHVVAFSDFFKNISHNLIYIFFFNRAL